jgi:hypothetical protein
LYIASLAVQKQEWKRAWKTREKEKDTNV